MFAEQPLWTLERCEILLGSIVRCGKPRAALLTLLAWMVMTLGPGRANSQTINRSSTGSLGNSVKLDPSVLCSAA
jgi:hypothetical protein